MIERIRRAWNKRFYCPFWGCQPPAQSTWWHQGETLMVKETRNGLVPVAAGVRCEKCGDPI